jgi:2-dehydro-3-deoxy-L-rhamnonate dehydrogenase (NAD+)
VTQRRALVTGGASGIGAACATRLTADGIDVVTTDLAAGADERVDVSDPDSVAALRDRVGAVDVLVNSAGIIGPSAPLVDLDLNAWRRTFAVNTDGTFLMCRAFAPAMVERGWGRIVNVASIAAKDGNPTQSAYSASKAAVIALTKSLGKELADKGVLVNCVTPAAAKTDIFAQMTPQFIEFMLSRIPMGRFVAVEEIAALVCWLASEDCSFSTGAAFDISGGRATY